MERVDRALSRLYRVMCFGVYPLFLTAILPAFFGPWARPIPVTVGILMIIDGATSAVNFRGVMERTLQANPWMIVYGSNRLSSFRSAGVIEAGLGSGFALMMSGIWH